MDDRNLKEILALSGQTLVDLGWNDPCPNSENKEFLRYELAENLRNLKEQATRLQKCIAENGTLKKCFFITKQELESWKLIKQRKLNLILHSY